MTGHVFDIISSPSCSDYALKKTVSDNVKNCREEVSSILGWNFYVDEKFLKCKDSCCMIQKVKLLCTLEFIIKMAALDSVYEPLGLGAPLMILLKNGLSGEIN